MKLCGNVSFRQGGRTGLPFLQAALVLGTAMLLAVPARVLADSIATNAGSGLDMGVSENGGGDDGNAGTNDNINARYNNNDKNEMIVLRFDTSSLTKSSLANASLNMTAFRDSNNNKNLWFFGVNSGVSGLNTYAESAKFSETPGLTWDDDPTTQGIVAADTTDLGTLQLDGTPTKGSLITYSAPALTTWLQGLADTDMATILITYASTSNGQFRIATKESTALDGGDPTGDAGAFAPYLEYRVVPEPATLALLGLGLAFVGVVRRRR